MSAAETSFASEPRSKREVAAAALGARDDLRYAEKKLLAENRLEEILPRLHRNARWHLLGWSSTLACHISAAVFFFGRPSEPPMPGVPGWTVSFAGGFHVVAFFLYVGFAIRSVREVRALARLRAELAQR